MHSITQFYNGVKTTYIKYIHDFCYTFQPEISFSCTEEQMLNVIVTWKSHKSLMLKKLFEPNFLFCICICIYMIIITDYLFPYSFVCNTIQIRIRERWIQLIPHAKCLLKCTTKVHFPVSFISFIKQESIRYHSL